MDWTGLKLILEGIEPKQIKRKKHFAREINWGESSGAADPCSLASTHVDGATHTSPQRR